MESSDCGAQKQTCWRTQLLDLVLLLAEALSKGYWESFSSETPAKRLSQNLRCSPSEPSSVAHLSLPFPTTLKLRRTAQVEKLSYNCSPLKESWLTKGETER